MYVCVGGGGPILQSLSRPALQTAAGQTRLVPDLAEVAADDAYDCVITSPWPICQLRFPSTLTESSRTLSDTELEGQLVPSYVL